MRRGLWIDISGYTLTQEDKEILQHPAVSGLILFSKNYESLAQLQALTKAIKAAAPHVTITVDQEGGRVQRFQHGFTKLPAMHYWGERFLESRDYATQEFKKILSVMIAELSSAGVQSSLVPVLDIDYGRNAVIGERSFGRDISTIVALADVMIDYCHQHHFPVTGKHFPGHGWVTADSHLSLPVDERSLDEIMANDLQPFIQLHHKLDAIMLAHVVYAAIDPLPVCFSRFWIQTILREQLHYRGIVMCDDLTMQAVATYGDYTERANRALDAGCDVLLVCNARSGVISILDNVSSFRPEG
ncbi:MAG: beta-N-acetylhexosaminidase [Gammaproteobacteria bacterium RIFCSPLOWO2_02_FULL_42_14]|nr:MAG: beta-N-acetylhexosaminidase [Gammaproteobacteria bacterium RIFCSPHIGHO2_02_FULL_42_43]OGT28876.1 MAG: beta-N-acetylhexosaminidase [Gammaproteobacteria bacterium RIFCSPHIGHO2_01_FULL_42_8]OGT52380.1 MAG: beta-N-acetylhexosaminidase [Gammaproteobacteria bacterium RIFCSPHIGHO2_12_FULL_41_25]OGT62492.1 MAG: beta-N-acetylhexosaminidase [Gammaproteobacteria bacterium RIFCSPLOWO2_02_FULL_42_14]OGT86296.1 MAG: beta-N-acetylhexosaminidase [Gammaproteobacteria bacterium RIFCSPLOWO2_12_FULL_42_18]